ncbi:MAG: hypothetical protein ABL996_16440, partial [Micropepsaceae bacterium]
MKPAAHIERLRRLVKRATKEILGRTLVTLRPDIVRKIEAGGVDAYLSHFRDQSLVERLVLEAVIARRHAKGAVNDLVQSHAAYWSSDKALAFHGRGGRRLETGLLG